MLRLKNLGSGSAGNATLIEGSDGLRTRRLLVDCGLGVRQLAARLDQAGLAWSDIAAIFITHEHSDHLGCCALLTTWSPSTWAAGKPLPSPYRTMPASRCN
jgi:glyoxylase-like metal-dependent hydrolase (beta-lactamase superfamily II)